MKHPICPPEYVVSKQATYQKAGVPKQFICLYKGEREIAELEEDGVLWEVWDGRSDHTQTAFPSLDAAIQYVETKMALGILGEKE